MVNAPSIHLQQCDSFICFCFISFWFHFYETLSTMLKFLHTCKLLKWKHLKALCTNLTPKKSSGTTFRGFLQFSLQLGNFLNHLFAFLFQFLISIIFMSITSLIIKQIMKTLVRSSANNKSLH